MRESVVVESRAENMDGIDPYRLLLVEDDRELASMVADFLSSHGFEVLIEGNTHGSP